MSFQDCVTNIILDFPKVLVDYIFFVTRIGDLAMTTSRVGNTVEGQTKILFRFSKK